MKKIFDLIKDKLKQDSCYLEHLNNSTKNEIIAEGELNRAKWEDCKEVIAPDGTKIDMESLLEDQARAKAALRHIAPELGGLVSELRFVYTFRVQTQATDGYNVFVNPQFTNGLDLTGKTFVLAHEILHCLLNHLRRAKQAGHNDQYKSNVAADYEVNSTLVEMGLFKAETITKLKAFYDKKYADLGYETIYDTMPSPPKNNSQDNSQNGNNSNSDKSGGDKSKSNSQRNSQSQSKDDKTKDQSKGDKSNGNNSQKQNGNKGNQGGSTKNDDGTTDQQAVSGSDTKDPSGELKDVPETAGGMISKEAGDKIAQDEGYLKDGGSQNNVERQWEDIGKKVSNELSKKAGTKPGYQQLADKLHKLYATTKDWKKELKRIVGNSLSDADTRSAYANKNVLSAQGRISRTDKDKFDNTDCIMAWIDTSGSMTEEYLIQCLSEVYALALAKKPMKLVIMQFDTRVADIQEFNSLSEFKRNIPKMTIKGRGGTDVKCCFDELIKNKKYSNLLADCVLIFTDGYLAQYPRDKKHMKHLIWIVENNPNFELQYRDMYTKLIRLDLSEVQKRKR